IMKGWSSKGEGVPAEGTKAYDQAKQKFAEVAHAMGEEGQKFLEKFIPEELDQEKKILTQLYDAIVKADVGGANKLMEEVKKQGFNINRPVKLVPTDAAGNSVYPVLFAFAFNEYLLSEEQE